MELFPSVFIVVSQTITFMWWYPRDQSCTLNRLKYVSSICLAEPVRVAVASQFLYNEQQ